MNVDGKICRPSSVAFADVICDFGWQQFRRELSGLFGTDLKDKALYQVSFPRLVAADQARSSDILRISRWHADRCARDEQEDTKDPAEDLALARQRFKELQSWQGKTRT
jgi:hypothetical protein